MSAIRIGFNIEGELTKKQRETIRIIEKILYAFYNEKQEKQERTWKDLLRITKLPKGTLHKYLVELVGQGVIKGEVKVENNRLTRFFKYTEKFVRIKGKAEVKVREVTFIPKDERSREAYLGYKIIRKARIGTERAWGRKKPRRKWLVKDGKTERWRDTHKLRKPRLIQNQEETSNT